MEVKEVKDKNSWENFLLECREKTFLQSWNWGEFQEKMGHKIWRLGLFEKSALLALALVSKITAKRGKFLLVQHGPVVKKGENKKKILAAFLGELKGIGREEKASFIRMNPLLEDSQENQKIVKELGLREAPMHANAYEATWKLDISPSDEELLMEMRKTTRYLIRQTLKNKDIVVEKTEGDEGLEVYQQLNLAVAKRQKFVPFSSKYIKNEFEVFSKDKQALLILGKYQGEVVAAVLVIFWSGVAFYHQAASSTKYAKLSIPYLLQWEAIKEAKKRGCQIYDFWGFTDPQKYPGHPWAGPTLFKMGFGGEKAEYLKTQDLPLSGKYWLTYLFEKLRRSKRSL